MLACTSETEKKLFLTSLWRLEWGYYWLSKVAISLKCEPRPWLSLPVAFRTATENSGCRYLYNGLPNFWQITIYLSTAADRSWWCQWGVMAASHYIHYDGLLYSVMITRIPVLVLVLLELTECSSSKCGYFSGISQICVILYLLRGEGKWSYLLIYFSVCRQQSVPGWRKRYETKMQEKLDAWAYGTFEDGYRKGDFTRVVGKHCCTWIFWETCRGWDLHGILNSFSVKVGRLN